jgi:photosystem II stability/assembly factor-like uncharacterized protein
MRWRQLLVVMSFLIVLGCPVRAGTSRGATTGGWAVVASLPGQPRLATRSPYDSKIIIAGMYDTGVYVCLDGKTFKKLSTRLDGKDIRTIAFLAPSTVWVGTMGDGLWSSLDLGTTWERVENLTCTNISSIFVDSAVSRNVYVASLCTGVHVTADTGKTWRSLPLDIEDQHTTGIDRVDGSTLAVSTSGQGLLLVTGGEKTVTRSKCPEQAIVAVAASQNSGWLAALTGTSLAVSRDKGTTWTIVGIPGGFRGTAITAVPSGLMVVGTVGGGVIASSDAGRTFFRMAGGAPGDFITGLSAQQSMLTACTSAGTVVEADLLMPMLGLDTIFLDFGSIVQQRERTMSVKLANLGGGTLSGSFDGFPAYVGVSPALYTPRISSASITVKTADLEQRSHAVALRLTGTGGSLTMPLRFAVVASAPTHIVLRIGQKTATVDGVVLTLEAAPFIEPAAGRTMVPVRLIAEALGADVAWSPVTRTVTIKTTASATRKATTIVLQVGSRQALVDGRAQLLDAAAQIREGRTFVPVRMVAENLGASVRWDAGTQTVSIETLS